MNKTKIEWTDYTWNPVTGCLHGCSYCYARGIANRFPRVFPLGFDPTFHPDRLDEPKRVKKPSKIFVVSMGDLFGDWVSDEWIKAVGLASQAAPWHTYQFLTKNPERYAGWQFPSQAWIGATATDQPSYNRAAVALQRAHDVQERAVPTFVSVEPMLGPVGLDSFYSFPSWLIIGAQTGRRAEQPDPSWVRDLIAQADDLGIPVFTKNSLPDWDRKEFPRSA